MEEIFINTIQDFNDCLILKKVDTLTLKCVNFVNFVNFL